MIKEGEEKNKCSVYEWGPLEFYRKTRTAMKTEMALALHHQIFVTLTNQGQNYKLPDL